MSIIEAPWRLATSTEIAELKELEGAPHVNFGCTSCGMVNWTAKNIALSDNGAYNGSRNIFVSDWSRRECSCPPSYLRCVVPT